MEPCKDMLRSARTVYVHRIFGDFPAKNSVRTLYKYGSDQP
jgi:hypothetical protein